MLTWRSVNLKSNFSWHQKMNEIFDKILPCFIGQNSVLNILLTSPNKQISEFRIPNIYDEIFVLIFFNDSENTFWGFFEI